MEHEITPRSRLFSFRGVSYRYVTWNLPATEGALAAPVVLVHGFSQSAATWEGIAPHIAQGRVVHAFDLVGHGGSDRPEAALAYGIEAQAEALLAFLSYISAQEDANASGPFDGSAEGVVPHPFGRSAEGSGPRLFGGGGIGRSEPGESRQDSSPKPVVVGYSMGGRVALAALCHDPHPFGTLVLEAAGLGPLDAAERSAASDRDFRNAARLRAEGIEAFMDFWEELPLFATQHALPDTVRERIRAERLSNDPEALARSFEHAGQHAMPSRSRVLEALEKSGVPVLYLAGELDRKYRSLSEDVAALPCAEVRVISGAGHDTHLENPSEFVRCLANFLESVSSGSPSS